MSQTRAWVWFKRFKANQASVKDNNHPGHKHTTRMPAKVESVAHALVGDRRKTVRMIAEETGILKTGVHTILKKDMNLSKITPKLIPKDLTGAQQGHRLQLCRSNLELLRQDKELICRVITGDESWVSLKETETKQCSLEWIPKGSPGLCPMKARPQRAVCKVMITVFFDWEGVILVDFLPPGETVDTDCYLEVLATLKERIRRKQPHLWAKKTAGSAERNFVIHHDNASPHTADITIAIFENIDLLPHPTYSPNLAPSDYFIFPRLKSELAKQTFRNIEELKKGVHNELQRIPAEDFNGAMRQLPLRWMKCVAVNGSYFEGRHFSVDPADFGLQELFEPPSDPSSSSNSDQDTP